MSDHMSDDLKHAADAAKAAADEAAATVKQGAATAADAVTDAAGQAADATQRAADSTAKSTKASLDELTQTVERLSNQVADSARTAWESEQRKEIQDSVIKGLNSIAAAIEDQVKKLSETDDAKRFATKMEETTDRISEHVRSSSTFQDIADGLVKGFSAAAVSIEKWLGQQEGASSSKGEAGAVQEDDGTQSIMITRPADTLPPVAPPDADDQLSAPDSTVHF